MRTSTPAQYALILIDLVERGGHAQQHLLKGTSLAVSGVSGIGARISDEDFARLVNNALAVTKNPSLGLDLGLKINLSSHAVLGQAFLTCQDLAEVLDLFLKYYHLISPMLQLDFKLEAHRCFLTTYSVVEDIPVTFGHELLYAGILNTLSGLLNLPNLQLRVELPYPPPAYVERYHEVFGQEVYFNALVGRVSFDETLLTRALPSSNPALRNLYEAECARLVKDLETDSVSEQTLLLLKKLEGQYPQMPQVAAMLNYSARTYRRRLDTEHTSYQSLLDEVRAEHATRYLTNTRMSVASIAYAIGFNDASNFSKAYSRWTGKSPASVRNKKRVRRIK